MTDVHPILEALRDGRPSWLDDHRAQELAAFRARFTDLGWIAFRDGQCSHAMGRIPAGDVLCLRSRRHGRVLCDLHVREVRQGGEWHPHMTSVPMSVSSMDLSEVP